MHILLRIVYVSYIIFTINTENFLKQHNRLAPVMDTKFVLCEAGNKFLCIF
jgi:hypothetical protein